MSTHNPPFPGHHEVSKVQTITGETVFVRTDHLADAQRATLPRYTYFGLPWTCTRAGAQALAEGLSVAIARTEIAKA